MNALEKLDEKSTYRIIKYRDILMKLQLEELQPIIEKCKRLITSRCTALGSKSLVGKYFKFYQKTYLCYMKVEKFNEIDGSLTGTVSYPLNNQCSKRIGQKNRKYWVCNFYREEGTWQIYGTDAACELEEITSTEYENIAKITKWKTVKTK